MAGEKINKETAVNYNGSLALAIARAGDHNYVAEIQSTSNPDEQLVSGDIQSLRLPQSTMLSSSEITGKYRDVSTLSVARS